MSKALTNYLITNNQVIKDVTSVTGSLIMGVRDEDGTRRRFAVFVQEVKEPPQPQDGAAAASEGGAVAQEGSGLAEGPAAG